MDFMETLKDRNDVLFWFGLANLVAAAVFLFFSWVNPIEFKGTNAWFKPVKFALSIAILAWSMGWYTGYLPHRRDIAAFNWIIVATLAFEVLYIALQASRGQASHYNLSTPFYSVMYVFMALAATVATVAVGYIGMKFFTEPLQDLPNYYLWAIRFGILLFVIFSFEGFAMGSRLAHTVGKADGGKGLPFLNWSVTQGDLRIAHFIGMHALQVFPLLARFIMKDIKLTIGCFVIYSLLAVFVLLQALCGNPIIQK
ncbi:MAG: hypothetical protein H6558_00210 [Lewinellaceae bacterium]|nr:hypothetical protein [Lewinellaceae bacterium]